MARVPTVDPADFAPELAEALGHPTSDRRVALGSLTAWANRPELALSMVRFQREMEASSRLDARLRELVRLRIAFHNQCRSCLATRSIAATHAGMTDGAVCSLERPEEAADLTDAEKAALRYADLLATDHLAADDALFVRLREHFDDGEIVELGAHVAWCVGFGRVAMTWDLVEALPPSFQDKSAPAVPWSSDVVMR